MRKFFSWSERSREIPRSKTMGGNDRQKRMERRRLRMESLETRTLLAVTAGGFDWTPQPTGETIVMVTTANDVVDPSDGVVSLREAIASALTAGSGNRVMFDSSLAGRTCVLSLGALKIDGSVTIDASNLVGGFTVDGNNMDRVFTITGSFSDVTLRNLTIQNGMAPANSEGVALGGGIYSTAGNLKLLQCVIQNNRAESIQTGGNAVAYGGGIYATRSLYLSQGTITGNVALAENTGTGAYFRSEAIGGGIYATDLVVTHAMISENVAQATSLYNYAVAKGGGLFMDGTVVNSLVNLNTAQAYSQSSSTSSEIYAMAFGGGVCQGGDVKVTNSTIAKNSAWAPVSKDGIHYSYGGGICALSVTDVFEVDNSIVLLNNTSRIKTIKDLSLSNDYDICYYHGTEGEDFPLSGVCNVSSYSRWDTGTSANVVIDYNAILEEYGSLQNFLDAFFVDVYDPFDTNPANRHEDYNLQLTSKYALDRGNDSFAVEADGTTIIYDLAGNPRIFNQRVDIGAYELSQSLVVNTALDVVDEEDGLTSLREAILHANDYSITAAITFDSSLNGQTITLDDTLGAITITGDLSINASGLSSGITIAAPTDGRILEVSSDVSTLFLSNLFFTGGISSEDGGAIYSEAGSLSIQGGGFSGNSAVRGGAIYATGDLTIDGVSFNGNNASGSGGAIFVEGNLTATDSRFIGNAAGGDGGAMKLAGSNVLTSVIVSTNSAVGNGGGIAIDEGFLLLINSQIDNNNAATGGGLAASGDGIVRFRNVTVTANNAGTGAGISVSADSSLSLYNSIVALNGTPTTDSEGKLVYPDLSVETTATADAYRVLSSFTDWTNSADGEWTAYDSDIPLFSGQDSDGVYLLDAMAFQAIDVGNNAYAIDPKGATLKTDIKGNNRIVQATEITPATVDLGAVEYQKSVVWKEQYVYGDPASYSTEVGECLALSIYHKILNDYDDQNVTTLSLRIHFNSGFLSFDPSDPGIYLTQDLTGAVNFTVYEDSDNFDGDITTDRYILVTWNNQKGLWNGAEWTEIFTALNFKVRSDIDVSKASQTTVRFTAKNVTANYGFTSDPITIKIAGANFDVDGDGIVNISTDANLILRYFQGKRDEALVNNLLYSGSKRTASEIADYIHRYETIFDIDGNGQFDAAIDGTLLTRYLAGFRGSDLISGITFSGGIRNTSSLIENYIANYLTGKSEAEPTTSNYHVVTPSAPSVVIAGSDFTLNLTHSLKLVDPSLYGTTLTIRVFYNSHDLDVRSDALSLYKSGLIGPVSGPILFGTDSGNQDDDPLTDSYFQVTWNSDSDSGWATASASFNLVKGVLSVKGDVTSEGTTGINILSTERTAGFAMAKTSIQIAFVPTSSVDPKTGETYWAFDIDRNGTVDIATDANLLLRYKIFGNLMTVDDLLTVDSTRTPDQIIDYLNQYSVIFDLDGDGSVKLDTDVNYLMRFLADYRGDALIGNNPPPSGAIRKTGDAISAYIKDFIPPEQRTDPVIVEPGLENGLDAIALARTFGQVTPIPVSESSLSVTVDNPLREEIDPLFVENLSGAIIPESFWSEVDWDLPIPDADDDFLWDIDLTEDLLVADFDPDSL